MTVEADMSVYRLATLTGLSESHLKKLIDGEVKNPRPETIRALAAAVGRSPEWILHGDEVVQEIGIGLTEPQIDVLNALVFLEDSDLASLLRQAIGQYVDSHRSDPDVQEMISRLLARRRQH